MKTFSVKPNLIKRSWFIVNAEGKILGRLATKLAYILSGKHKTEYTPHLDMGDYLIVLNASKIIVSGKKYRNKVYYHHTGYAGGLKKNYFREIIISHPERIIEISVKGMLPKGPLGRSMIKKMKVYSGNKHNHISQKAKILDI